MMLAFSIDSRRLQPASATTLVSSILQRACHFDDQCVHTVIGNEEVASAAQDEKRHAEFTRLEYRLLQLVLAAHLDEILRTSPYLEGRHGCEG
jgi:hypothetical protein